MQPLTGLTLFISYPRGGPAHTWAPRVEAALRGRGARCFLDEHAIADGDPNWLRRLEDGLLAAQVMVALIDHSSAACGWQQRELIRADALQLPVVVLRLGAVDLPLAVAECQPVALRPADPEGSLQRLASAVAAATPRHPTANNAAPDADRALETEHLRALLSGDLSDHEARYVPLAAQERRALGLERAIKGLRIDTTALLQHFSLPGERLGAEAAPVPHSDVLAAYLSLPQRRVRRLVVLGEPGAGKSFSLERLAVHHARAALLDAAAPLPVLVRLGLWTRADEPLQAFIERQLNGAAPGLGRRFSALRDARRLVLLLDGLNEIPPGQRAPKAAALRALAEDERLAAVVLSCRERDFAGDSALPFDRLVLQPLSPPQVHRFLHRLYTLAEGEANGAERAEARFWQLAGGEALRAVWAAWQGAGASLEQFWTADDIPRKNPAVYSATTGTQDALWRQMRSNTRSLMTAAANPYLLTMMAMLPVLPATRAALFGGFLAQLHARERKAREQRHDVADLPPLADWLAVLVQVADALQRSRPASGAADTGTDTDTDIDIDAREADGATTTLPRARWPAALTGPVLAFCIDASVLQLVGDDLRFTHQLLQESLSARVLLQASAQGQPPATEFWPADRWWQPSGWEVVAELAAEHCAADPAALQVLLAWLAAAQPEVAARAWRQAGAPALPAALGPTVASAWGPRLTDAQAEPVPAARAAIGRALAAFGLDRRPGVGLRPDGLPDIDWVPITTPGQWMYQGRQRAGLPPFDIARYPVTHAQFQAFIDAGGYAPEAPWWQGLDHPGAPATPEWSDANAPRERVSWFEATAFCRWLGAITGQPLTLPTEQQWERAAAGLTGRLYPWGDRYDPGRANCIDGDIPGGNLGRTSAVGILPGQTEEGVHDLAGNVWEWTDSWYDKKDKASRVLRGGSWSFYTDGLRAAFRDVSRPGYRDGYVGFRLCRSSPIRTPARRRPAR